ncbi:MAG: efflux RND transporter permease subunit [Lachnospiraceae bacterium]|nr:efflux RND transporter permease subunit [Lachnospiraceae bacterium]
MNGIVKGALNKPVTVAIAIMGLVLFAIVSISNISLKLMPDMSIPYLVVQATYAGASPEEVDELVIDKINDKVQSITGISTITSESNENYGYVLMQFEYGTDMDEAYDDVKVAVDGIKGDFPDDVSEPSIIEIDMDSSDDMTLSITSDSADTDILSIVENYIEPELNTASALAEVTTTGGDEKYIRVKVIPEYLNQYGISLSSVASAISAVNFSMPTGSAEYGNQKLNLSAEVKYETIEDLEQVPIETDSGELIHVADIAEVKYAVSDKTSLSRYDGKENISIGLKRKQSSTSVELSNQVNKIVSRLRQEYPTLSIEIVSDASDTIMESLQSVATTVVEAVGLAMLVLFIFFGDLKAALIVGSSMPVSLLTTVILMNAMDLSLNVITMNALVLGIGMMTDNAVVVIEMCFRKRDEGMGFMNAAYEGTVVVMNSVIGSTITSVVTYLPLATMEGLSGQMFKQLGFTIIFTLLSSLISAITLVPVFFNLYKPTEKKNTPVTRVIDVISVFYGNLLKKFLKWKKFVVVLSILLLVMTGFLATKLRTELMSSTDEGVVNVTVSFRNNLTLAEMDKVMTDIEKYIDSVEEIDDYTTTITQSSAQGTVAAYVGDDVKKTTQEIVDEWNESLKGFSPYCEISCASGSTTGASSMSSADTKEYDLVSEDYDKLKAAANEIKEIMMDTSGVTQAKSSLAEAGTKVDIDIDPVMAENMGFTPSSLASQIYLNMEGSTPVEDVMIDGNKYDIKVNYPDEYFANVSDVESMTFKNSSGVYVPITEIADVKLASSSTGISRKDGKYLAKVTATMSSARKDEITDELEKKIRAIELDDGVSFATDAMTEMMQEEFASIGLAIVIAFFLVFAVMAIQFESIIYSLLVMMCVPFAAIGSVVLLLLMNDKISMSSLMGILMLAGIVVNNGIILIDMAMQNQKSGMSTYDALIDAGTGRLRPIFITTLTTELAMIPVAFGFAKNSENMKGMGIVMVGGLVASTILTLLFLPTFFLIIENIRDARKRRKQARLDKKIEKKDRKSAAKNKTEDIKDKIKENTSQHTPWFRKPDDDDDDDDI